METEILTKLSKGDKTAFKYVFDMYYSSICLFIKKYNFDIEQAEDIAQEVFIKIWEKKLIFKNSLAFKAYLYQTAKNLALNVLQHEAVKKRYQEQFSYNLESEDFFFQTFIEQDSYRLILQVVDKLNPRAKEVLYLNLEGLKNQEIANQLGISINTVRAHKVSAYKFLKMNLRDLVLLILFLLFR